MRDIASPFYSRRQHPMQPQLYEYLIVAASVSSPESFFRIANETQYHKALPFWVWLLNS